MDKIAPAFVKAQQAFGPALKTSKNPHLKNMYADLGNVIEAVIDALHANGIALLQRQHPHEGGVAIETIFIHESGEQISGGTLTVPAPKQDPQGYGSALTYARRYSLLASCGIAPEDDDGNAGSKQRQPQARQQEPARQQPARQAAESPAPSPAQKVADKVAQDVADGCAVEAAQRLAAMDDVQRNVVWALLADDTVDALTAVWPE